MTCTELAEPLAPAKAVLPLTFAHHRIHCCTCAGQRAAQRHAGGAAAPQQDALLLCSSRQQQLLASGHCSSNHTGTAAQQQAGASRCADKRGSRSRDEAAAVEYPWQRSSWERGVFGCCGACTAAGVAVGAG